jgi:uncharacterized protein (DUF305 family)
METKPLLFGLIGFFIGGLIVSIAATTFDKPTTTNDSMSMDQMTNSLRQLNGDDFDKAFIANMIDHHQSAVDMAKLADRRAKRQEIKDMSADIISAQQNEIDQMQSWQRQWGYDRSPAVHTGH